MKNNRPTFDFWINELDDGFYSVVFLYDDEEVKTLRFKSLSQACDFILTVAFIVKGIIGEK